MSQNNKIKKIYLKFNNKIKTRVNRTKNKEQKK